MRHDSGSGEALSSSGSDAPTGEPTAGGWVVRTSTPQAALPLGPFAEPLPDFVQLGGRLGPGLAQ